jgi:hypothetical protein
MPRTRQNQNLLPPINADVLRQKRINEFKTSASIGVHRRLIAFISAFIGG